MNRSSGQQSGAHLKSLLAGPLPVVAAGVYDALSAWIAQQAGFSAVYLSGASIAYTRLGRSDVGLTTVTEVVDTLSRLTDRIDIPVIVDADTGFGNALNVQRTVRDLERAGGAMIQLEDQSFPKRCGHLDGKSLIPSSQMQGKLRAALDARRDSNTLILARTDALAVEGFESALERAAAYLECGVHALFIEALRTPEQMKQAGEVLGRRAPLLANMVEGGKSPLLDATTLAAMGFRLVIFPGAAARVVSKTLMGFYQDVLREQSTASWQDRMLDFNGLNDLIGTPALLNLGKKYEAP